MTKEMENNIIDKDNTQFFSDTIYEAFPYNNNRLKLWVFVAFNKRIQHIILSSLIFYIMKIKKQY